MKLINLLHACFTLFSLTLVETHAVTPEVYWNNVLPNTPMPKAIKESLIESNEVVGVGRDSSQISLRNPFRLGYNRRPSKDELQNPFRLGYSRPPLKDELQNPFRLGYNRPPSKNELDNVNVAWFFLENDLYQGAEMSVHFTKNNQKSTFSPRKITFSSNNLPQIYNHFSIKPDSMEAEDVMKTLHDCENMIEGEETYCATSLESMIDFSTATLGQKVKAISTEVNTKENTPLQRYKIELAQKLSDNAAVCHKRSYAYALFFCHKTLATQAYAVSMVGADGLKVNAVAVCHTDTTKWNPKHLAFQVLKVKPGDTVCHFLPEDHVVWVSY